MFTIDDFKIQWQYDNVLLSGGKTIRTVSCDITRGERRISDSLLVHDGEFDAWDKRKARKLALSLALKKMTADRDFRKVFWEGYFRMQGTWDEWTGQYNPNPPLVKAKEEIS